MHDPTTEKVACVNRAPSEEKKINPQQFVLRFLWDQSVTFSSRIVNFLIPPNKEVSQSDTFKEAKRNLKVDLDDD